MHCMTLLMVVVLMDPFWGLHCSLHVVFLRHFRLTGFSSFLGFPLYFWLHAHSFTHCLASLVFWSPDRSLTKSFQDTWILHTQTTSTTQMTSSPSSCLVYLHLTDGCRAFRVPEWLNIVNLILRNQFSRLLPFLWQQRLSLLILSQLSIWSYRFLT